MGFEDFDLFYTYLTLQDEFAELIAQRAKAGAVFMVYGLDRIMPRHRDLRLLTPGEPLKGIVALYQKKGGVKKNWKTREAAGHESGLSSRYDRIVQPVVYVFL